MYLQLAENNPTELAGFRLRNLSLRRIVKGATGGVKKVVTTAVRTGKKLGLAVPRNAYLGIIALNFKGVATKLKRAIDSEPDTVRKRWELLGGNFADLKKVVNSGAKKKHLLEGEEYGEEQHIVLSEDDQTGDIIAQELSAPAVAAAVAAAAPIIAALAPLVARFSRKEDDQGISLEQQAAGIAPDDFVDPTDPANTGRFDTERGVSVVKTSGIGAPVLLIGAAGILFLLMSKKR